MDPYRGFRHRLLNKRQDLGGVLGGLFPNDPSSSTAKQATTTPPAQNTGDPSDPDGILGGTSSLIGDTSSVITPSLGTSSTTSNTPLIISPSSSAGSTTTPTSTSPAQATTLTTSTTSATPTPTSVSTSSSADTVYTSSDGTSVVYLTSTLHSPSATSTPSPSFLQNRPLQGGVFTLVAIVVLTIILTIVTCIIRKRRRNRLERDLAAAVTFDPGATDQYERQESSVEKRRLSRSSSGHGYGRGYGYGVQPAYAPPQDYLSHVGYSRYPAATYGTSSSKAGYQPPSPTAARPTGQGGGANLTRKFSDRKPVPPLIPDPTYDPSNAYVPVPRQHYQQ